MTAYLCCVCGTLALPTNSYLVDGKRFVHRACRDKCIDDAITKYVRRHQPAEIDRPHKREPWGQL